MATEFLSFIFAYSEEELSVVLPLTYDSLDNDGEIVEVMARKMEEEAVLQSLSRKNWLFYTIKDIYEASEFSCLQFLTNNWAILNPEQVIEVANGFEVMFKRFKAEPKIIVDITRYSLDEVVEVIRDAKPSLDPDSGGDGDDVEYLILYLISVKSLLEDAARKGLYVMYIQPQRMAEKRVTS